MKVCDILKYIYTYAGMRHYEIHIQYVPFSRSTMIALGFTFFPHYIEYVPPRPEIAARVPCHDDRPS
jgi:hypothetical protein